MNEFTAENLQLWRGDTHVLRGVSFALEGGQCLQVAGANGAGKTTLLRALCGLMPLEAGSIRWRGFDIATEIEAFHAELAYLGHDNGLKGDLSVIENLRYATRLRRRVEATEIAAALVRNGLVDVGTQRVRHLSAGQRRRVALARLMLGGGVLWILDEPAANLDVRGQGLVLELLEAHLGAGGAAVVATHQSLDLRATQLRSLTLQ